MEVTPTLKVPVSVLEADCLELALAMALLTLNPMVAMLMPMASESVLGQVHSELVSATVSAMLSPTVAMQLLQELE